MSEKNLRKRSEISDEYKWKMTDLFASDKEWEEEVKQLEELAGKMEVYQGKLAENAGSLLSFFKLKDEILYHFDRVYVYANQKSHEDTKVTKYQAYAAQADSVMIKVESAYSFANPEILDIPSEKMEEFYKEEPELLTYKRAIDEILRRKKHTLSKSEEAILAGAGEIATSPSNIFSMFNNADMKFPTVTDVEGNRIQITHGNYLDMLLSKDRGLRRDAFLGVYNSYKKWGNTISAVYISKLKQDNFFARTRKYSNTREMYLADGNIPESVYDNLLQTVNAHLPALHRYMALRKKLLNLEHLHMYDVLVPIIDDAGKKYSFQEAKELVSKALEPMGEEYVSVLREGMESGWIDVYENENKRSGAYSWGAYGSHPYVLLNYQDNLNDVFTLAHEMGHSMHTYFSNKAQPITYAGYSIFVAEVASTCNESLLMQYMLNNTTDEKEKLYLLNHYLEGFRTTLFRQTQFAEFEYEAHKRLEEGQALTLASLNEICYSLNKKYYGDDTKVDQIIEYEWMRIPHFYTPYYVYQYSTGYSAAVAFSKMILEEGKPAVDRYINNFLSGGSHKDPIDLLAAAGVDMSTAKPVEDALNVFEKYLDEFEKKVELLNN